MRRLRRRRPAGLERVPPPIASVVGQSGPHAAVLRIGPDRTLLDRPPGHPASSVAHVWYDTTPSHRLVRVEWPTEPHSSRPIAPLDLHLGHVLEFRGQGAAGTVCYSAIVDVTINELILIVTDRLDDAVDAAAQIAGAWRRTQIRSAAMRSWTHGT